jgi:hypothetical protein
MYCTEEGGCQVRVRHSPGPGASLLAPPLLGRNPVVVLTRGNQLYKKPSFVPRCLADRLFAAHELL